LDKFLRIMATISPIMGIGLGLWFSNYLDKNNALLIGIFIIFIAAVLPHLGGCPQSSNDNA
jgi:hypothetical protein